MSIKEEFNDEQPIIIAKEEENINIAARIGYVRLEIDACYPRINKLYGYDNVKKWMEACPPARRIELLECLSKEADLRTEDPIRGAGGRFMELQAAVAPNEAALAESEAIAALAKREAWIAYLEKMFKSNPFDTVACKFCIAREGKKTGRGCSPNCMFRHAVAGISSNESDYYATIKVYGYGHIKKWMEKCPKERRGEFLFCLSKEGRMRYEDPVRGIAGKIIEYEAAMQQNNAALQSTVQVLQMMRMEEPESKKFIELLRKGTEKDRNSAINCLRTALAPSALDAYPVPSAALMVELRGGFPDVTKRQNHGYQVNTIKPIRVSLWA